MSKLRTNYFREYYYSDIARFLRFTIEEDSSILELGSRCPRCMKSLKPKRALGILNKKSTGFRSTKNIKYKIKKYETFKTPVKYDYVILPDVLSLVTDVQKVFNNLFLSMKPSSRLIITYHNKLLLPFLNVAEQLGLKQKNERENWLDDEDILNLLKVENYEVVKMGRRFVFPVYIPLISNFINKYFVHIPLIRSFCLSHYIIARPIINENKKPSVSVVVPARNEEGNIKNIVKRIPKMGKHTEIIFVEGWSKDDTYAEIKRVIKANPRKDIKLYKQSGKGKADAVRKGFSKAKGDILMILDADMTVPPEDLTKFYEAIATNKGEYINGTRLVYPMQDQAMQTLNIWGNKFFSLAFSWILDQSLKDTLCGTKVLSRENYKKIEKNRDYFGDFDPFGDYDLIFGAAKLNLKFVEIPIRYQAREYGSTNISRFKHGFLLLKMTLFSLNKIKFI